MTDVIIKLVTLRRPLPKVEFPNGRVLQVHDATALTERLIREMEADRGNAEKTKAVLRNLVPDATDDDWEAVTGEDAGHILDLALSKTKTALGIVDAQRKNVVAGSVGGKKPRASRRSSPTTTSRTSVPELPAPTASPTGP